MEKNSDTMNSIIIAALIAFVSMNVSASPVSMAERVAGETAAKKVAEKVVEEATEKAAKATAEKVAAKAAEEAAQAAAEKAAHKLAVEAAKKAAGKTARREIATTAIKEVTKPKTVLAAGAGGALVAVGVGAKHMEEDIGQGIENHPEQFVPAVASIASFGKMALGFIILAFFLFYFWSVLKVAREKVRIWSERRIAAMRDRAEHERTGHDDKTCDNAPGANPEDIVDAEYTIDSEE